LLHFLPLLPLLSPLAALPLVMIVALSWSWSWSWSWPFVVVVVPSSLVAPWQQVLPLLVVLAVAPVSPLPPLLDLLVPNHSLVLHASVQKSNALLHLLLLRFGPNPPTNFCQTCSLRLSQKPLLATFLLLAIPINLRITVPTAKFPNQGTEPAPCSDH
jgi:hypothetical protein